jgi:hypothetical protein
MDEGRDEGRDGGSDVTTEAILFSERISSQRSSSATRTHRACCGGPCTSRCTQLRCKGQRDASTLADATRKGRRRVQS